MISWDHLMLLGGLLATILSMAGVAFWTVSTVRSTTAETVSSVRTTTAVLATQLEHLCAAVTSLSSKLDREVNVLEIAQRDHEHRITLLEQRCK
jgi:hypothetical protein